MAGPTDAVSGNQTTKLFERGPRALARGERERALSRLKERIRDAVSDLRDEERCVARLTRGA